jgi:hypothetical protein
MKSMLSKTNLLTAIDLSTASMKSIFSTTTLFFLPANKAASFTRFARSALQRFVPCQITFPILMYLKGENNMKEIEKITL